MNHDYRTSAQPESIYDVLAAEMQLDIDQQVLRHLREIDDLAAEMQLDEDQQVSRDLRQIREFGAVLPKIKTKLIKWKTEGF